MDEPDPPLPGADRVDAILAEWARERPELDAAPMGIVGRIARLALASDQALRPTFEFRGLGEGEFDVLATLRRAGAPYERTPGELGERTMVTSGAVSKRIDRLVAKGLVTRMADDVDARVRRIRLTEAGRALVDDAVVEHLAREEALLAPLDTVEREQLAGLLRRLLLPLER